MPLIYFKNSKKKKKKEENSLLLKENFQCLSPFNIIRGTLLTHQTNLMQNFYIDKGTCKLFFLQYIYIYIYSGINKTHNTFNFPLQKLLC